MAHLFTTYLGILKAHTLAAAVGLVATALAWRSPKVYGCGRAKNGWSFATHHDEFLPQDGSLSLISRVKKPPL